jgi:1-acyl-sn-glycerol-3-phosphate acyltransferase
MLQRISYTWRVIATGFSFMLFGTGGVVLSLMVFPIIKFLVCNLERQQEYIRWIISYTFKLFLTIMKGMGVLTISVRGTEKLASKQSVLVIANHPTLLDVVILIALLPSADCIIKQNVWRNPFMRGVVKAAGYISNSDPEMLLDACKTSLGKGNSIIIFPEGTRSVPGVKRPFQRGAANIAIKSEVDVLPVRIYCDPPTLVKGEKWYQVPQRKVHFEVSVGTPLSVKSFRQQANPSLAVRQLTRYFENYYS